MEGIAQITNGFGLLLFDAEVQGALHAFGAKKPGDGGCNLSNNSTEFFVGVISEPGRKYFIEGQGQVSNEDKSRSFFSTCLTPTISNPL